MVLMIKPEPVQHTVKWEIKRRKREERRRKGKESKRREDRGIKTRLQGQGHAESIICTCLTCRQRDRCVQKGRKSKKPKKIQSDLMDVGF